MTVWSADLTPLRTPFLQLEAAPSAAYNRFVYRDERQSEAVRGLLFDRGVAEFTGPYTSAMLGDGGVLEGFISVLSGDELRRCRMRSALAIAKAGFFAEDPDLHRRMQLAAATNVAVEDGDRYISRIAVHPEVAGRGRAGLLLGRAREQATAQGGRRLVLEVAADNEAALALYRKHGFSVGERREASDPLTGRAMALIHMARAV